jgi:uncharacterized membrane protein HdeD (DUF308 family)
MFHRFFRKKSFFGRRHRSPSILLRAWWKWLLLLAGFLFVAAGIYLFIQPVAALATAVLLIGFFFLLAGIFHIVSYFGNHSRFGRSGWIHAEGIIVLIIGILILYYPAISARMLLFLIGVWFLTTGIIRFVNAINMAQHRLPDWGWTLFFGLILTALGIANFFTPLFDLFALTTLLGTYLIANGIITILEFLLIDRLDHRKIRRLH